MSLRSFGVTAILEAWYLFSVAAPKQPPSYDPLFWFLDWTEVGESDPELSEYLRSSYPRESRQGEIVVHSSTLSFYRTFKLLRFSQLNPQPQRGYALYRIGKDGLSIKPLDGSSSAIQQTNGMPDELNIREETADKYLRFFCSAVQGDEELFLNPDPENYKEIINLAANPEAEAILEKEKGSWFRPVTDNELEKLSNPFPKSHIRPRVACIVYSSAAFRAWFAIDDSAENPGRVDIIEDDLILSRLEVTVPRYANGTLFVPPRLADEQLVAEDADEMAERGLSVDFAGVAEEIEEPTHYYSGVPEERAEVDQVLAELTGSSEAPGDTIDVELVFRDRGAGRTPK